MKKRILSLALAFAMVLCLAACNNSTSDDEANNSNNPQPGTNSTAGNTLPERNDAEASKTGFTIRDSLKIADESSPGDLSPWAGSNSGVVGLVYMVYETLFIIEHGHEMEPCLAKEWSQDGNVVTVTLFDNIVDSAGNRFTASDVVFSLDKCNEAGFVSYTRILESYEAKDDTTVILNLNDNLTVGDLETLFTNVYLVTQASYEASPDKMFSTPVGTGRYAVTKFEPNASVTFELRDEYWQTDEQYIASRSVPHVKTIEVTYVADAAQRAIAVETGAADVAVGLAYTDLDTVEAADGVTVYSYQMSLTRLLMPNCDESSPCSDINVRKAVFYALSNEGLAATYTGGTAKAVYDLSNSNYPDYYEDYYKSLAAEGNIYSYDLEKSKEFLDAAGYGPGELNLRLITDSSTASTDTATAIQAYLLEAGINCTIDPYQNNLLTEFAADETSWDLYLRQTASNSYATVAWSRPLSKNYYSWGGTCNFIFDDKLQEDLALVTTDAGHSEESVKELYQYIVDNAYGYGLFCAESYLAVPEDTTFVSMNASLMACYSSFEFAE